VQLVDLVVDNQAFGEFFADWFIGVLFYLGHCPTGLVDTTNVTFDDRISGIMGLGFPRLSTIYQSVVNGQLPDSLRPLHSFELPNLKAHHFFRRWPSKENWTIHFSE
jgi:hypothetical protein